MENQERDNDKESKSDGSVYSNISEQFKEALGTMENEQPHEPPSHDNDVSLSDESLVNRKMPAVANIETSMESSSAMEIEEPTVMDNQEPLTAVATGCPYGTVENVDDDDEMESSLLPKKRDHRAADNIWADVSEDYMFGVPYDESRPGTARFALRKKVRRGHNYATISTSEEEFNLFEPKPPPMNMIDCNSLWGMAFTQMSAREGVKRFGTKAEEALVNEWSQLDLLNVYKGVHFKDLTQAQRKAALRLVQLIKEKCSGKIKGRTCVDGRPQREYIPKEKATSPTVITESLMLSFMIDALEGRVVGTVDIPGAFLTSDTDEVIIVIADGLLVDMLIQSNPEYEQYIHVTKNGRRIVYLQLFKAMYGTLCAARIFFEGLTNYLNSLGFTANPYDRCVMNADMKGSQCTITFHVDDLKVSHKLHEIVE